MKSMKFMALLLSMAFVLSHAKNEDSKYWEKRADKLYKCVAGTSDNILLP